MIRETAHRTSLLQRGSPAAHSGFGGEAKLFFPAFLAKGQLRGGCPRTARTGWFRSQFDQYLTKKVNRIALEPASTAPGFQPAAFHHHGEGTRPASQARECCQACPANMSGPAHSGSQCRAFFLGTASRCEGSYGVLGRSATSQPAHSRAALNVHVFAPLGPAIA